MDESLRTRPGSGARDVNQREQATREEPLQQPLATDDEQHEKSDRGIGSSEQRAVQQLDAADERQIVTPTSKRWGARS